MFPCFDLVCTYSASFHPKAAGLFPYYALHWWFLISLSCLFRLLTSPVNFHHFSFSQSRRIGKHHDLTGTSTQETTSIFISGQWADFIPTAALARRIQFPILPILQLAAHLIPQAVPSPRNLAFTTLPLNPMALTICGSPGTRSIA